MTAPPTVIVSGCHSGPNPSPGVGVASSLRLAFPSAWLVARDFSPAATGLHAADFDEVWLCPAWEDADLDVQWLQLRDRLSEAWMIPGLDLEVRWVAGFEHPRVLAPSTSALQQVSKPGILAAPLLSVRTPDWLPLSSGDRAAERFCRQHGWRAWVKGPAYESRAVRSWQDLRAGAGELGQTWGREELFVQAHVKGVEVSVAFAAFQGELLDSVLLEKRITTLEGKVWGGMVSSVPIDLARALRSALMNLKWTGGGELEFIRDAHGDLWLFDWNPRFPAWVHGATLSGHNLPAVLLARAAGLPIPPAGRGAEGFVRTVTEIPLSTPLPPTAPGRWADLGGGKHPSGMPQLSRRLIQAECANPQLTELRVSAELGPDLLDASEQLRSTPCRVLLRRTAAARFARVAELKQGHPGLEIAYSVKTNPDRDLMNLAKVGGLWAETISREEIDWALGCGWEPSQIVYNGPVPLAGLGAGGKLRAAFADDPCILGRYLEAAAAIVVGVRLCPPFESSRFGARLDEPEEFGALVDQLRGAAGDQSLGVSFHVASSTIGLGRWKQLASSVIDFASTLEELSGRTLSLVDLGGGWSAEDLEDGLAPMVGQLMAEADARLAGSPTILIEPGKSLAEPSQAVLARVVHLRRGCGGSRAAVLDAGIADVPLIASYPHRLALVRGDVTLLDPGTDELLGPSCMEGDRLAEGIRLPDDIRVGDLIAVCDAGGYDASMAYDLGRVGRA